MYDNIMVLNKDGYYGYNEEKFDIIFSTIAVDAIPVTWINQLKKDGKIISPIVLGDDLTDYTFLIEKSEKEITARFLIHTSFLRALGKLSFKNEIKLQNNDFDIEINLNIPKKLFEFCVTYFNPQNENISIDSEYGLYRKGLLKFKGGNLLEVIKKLKNVNLFSTRFKGKIIYDYLNFIPY